jgi:hypothetical protein
MAQFSMLEKGTNKFGINSLSHRPTLIVPLYFIEDLWYEEEPKLQALTESPKIQILVPSNTAEKGASRHMVPRHKDPTAALGDLKATSMSFFARC